MILFGDDHATAVPRGRERRRETGRAGADDEDIAVREAAFITVGVCQLRRLAEASSASDQALVQVPARPHEGLVIETGHEKAREEIVYAANVEADAGPTVDRTGFETVVESDLGRAQVWCGARAGAELHQGVRLFGPESQNAARAMIFERAADQPNSVREEGGGEGVSRKARIGAAFEPEGQRPVAVDKSARAQAERLLREAHGATPPGEMAGAASTI